jgi:seryl-tRNA synthetase
MLEIQRIRQEKDAIIAGLAKRNIDASSTLDEILALDQQWRSAKTSLDQVAAEMNQLAKSIGELFKSGKQEEAATLKAKTTELKTQEAGLKEEVNQLEEALQKLLYTLPNVPNEMVVKGKDANDNQTVHEAGTIPTFNFEAQAHWDLA